MITITCDTREEKKTVLEALEDSDICVFTPTGSRHYYCDEFRCCDTCIKANIKFIVKEDGNE